MIARLDLGLSETEFWGLDLRGFDRLYRAWIERYEYEEKRSYLIAGTGIAYVLNALGAKRLGGGEFRPEHIFPDLREEQTPEDMLAIMRANTVLMGGTVPEA